MKIRDTHHIMDHFYESIKHLVRELAVRSNVTGSGYGRFIVYVGVRAKYLHCGGDCGIKVGCIYIGL